MSGSTRDCIKIIHCSYFGVCNVLGRMIYNATSQYACLREMICCVGDYIATNFFLISIIYEYTGSFPFKLLSHLILLLVYQKLGALKNFAPLLARCGCSYMFWILTDLCWSLPWEKYFYFYGLGIQDKYSRNLLAVTVHCMRCLQVTPQQISCC